MVFPQQEGDWPKENILRDYKKVETSTIVACTLSSVKTDFPYGPTSSAPYDSAEAENIILLQHRFPFKECYPGRWPTNQGLLTDPHSWTSCLSNVAAIYPKALDLQGVHPEPISPLGDGVLFSSWHPVPSQLI